MVEQQNQRKVRAILAGGLVLGVGAVLTMAAWNSSEFATGNFATGAFVLEGSTDGGTFQNHNEASPAGLSFDMPDAQQLSPGDSVSAPFSVRLSEATTSNASVKINAETASGLSGLSYRVYSTNGFGCATGEVSTIVSDTVLQAGATVVGTESFDLAKGAGSAAGDVVNLCFAVTAGTQAELTQGRTSSVVWELAASQNDAP